MELRKNYYNRAKEAYLKNERFVFSSGLSVEDIEHVISIAASVMMTRDKYLPGGSFVQSIVNNDLSDAFNRADTICERAIKFFVYVNNHVYLNN